MNPIWLNDRQVSELITHHLAYDAVVGALSCHANGDFDQPLKPYVRPQGRDREHYGGRFISMPAFVGGNIQMAGIKFIAGFPSNVEKGIPRASGTVQLNCTTTGRTISIMECATLSAFRTAAVAMIGIKHLAPKRKLKVAIIGAGPIGRTTTEALLEMYPDRVVEIRLCDIAIDRAHQVAHSINNKLITCFDNVEQAVRNADVVITATTGTKEYLQKSWLEQGWLFIALSLDDATPELFLSANKVIVDDFGQSCREEKLLHRLICSGQFHKEGVSAELGQVITGKRAGRLNDNENIYLNPMGMAIEDIALAAIAYNKAIQSGIGLKLI